MLLSQGVADRTRTARDNDDAASVSYGDSSRLIFVTNRGPVEHHPGSDGRPHARLGAGGVVSGLLAAAQGRPVSWISLAMTDADREIARAQGDRPMAGAAGVRNLTTRLVYVPKQVYRRHYDGISNRLLWFVQHGMPVAHVARSPRTLGNWRAGYVAVNAALADAVIAELDALGDDTPVMFHDYHVYLAAGMVRARRPRARLQHFTHIPWPTVETWEALPEEILRALYEGLAANDVLGFQTPRDARNFLDGAERYLPGSYVSRDPDEIYWRGRCIAVRAYPIALTPATVLADARRPEAQAQVEELRERLGLGDGRKLIVRVDRVEPTKNIVRGFQAYERLLGEHPEWRGRVTFLALLVPSREGLAEYRRYAERVRQVIEQINTRYGTESWQPVVALFGNDRARALACMRHYDVLLVNSTLDGMNLVVKEGGLLNERDGVIVLSKGAGAYAQLRAGVLGISPEDVGATSAALYEALTLPAGTRAELARRVRTVLERENAGLWLARQVNDLLRLRGQPASLGVARVAAGSATWRGAASVGVPERMRTRPNMDTAVTRPRPGVSPVRPARGLSVWPAPVPALDETGVLPG
jgi:trehalose 6-phosphate synthase